MNKFLTFPGVQPIYLGDLDYLQNATKETIGQIAQALLGTSNPLQNAILQGVEFSIYDDKISFTSGIVLINGEVLPIASGVVSANAVSELYFHVQSSLSGTRTFKDGQSHDCYDTRSAFIDTTSADGIAFSSMSRLVLSETYNYRPVIISGNITNGRLVRKNSFLFLELDFDIPESFSGVTIGTISFLRDDYLSVNLPESISFPIQAIIASEGLMQIEDLICYFNTAGNTHTIVLNAQTTLTSAGKGSCKGLIPAF